MSELVLGSQVRGKTSRAVWLDDFGEAGFEAGVKHLQS